MKGLVPNISATLSIWKSDCFVTGCWALKNEGLYTDDGVFWKVYFINLLWLNLVWYWNTGIERKISIWINICLHSLTNYCVFERFIFLSYKLINMEEEKKKLNSLHQSCSCWQQCMFCIGQEQYLGLKTFPVKSETICCLFLGNVVQSDWCLHF